MLPQTAKGEIRAAHNRIACLQTLLQKAAIEPHLELPKIPGSIERIPIMQRTYNRAVKPLPANGRRKRKVHNVSAMLSRTISKSPVVPRIPHDRIAADLNWQHARPAILQTEGATKISFLPATHQQRNP